MIRKPNLKSAETRLGKGGFQKIGPLKLITICRRYGMNLSFSQFKKLGSAWFIGLLCVSLAMPAQVFAQQLNNGRHFSQEETLTSTKKRPTVAVNPTNFVSATDVNPTNFVSANPPTWGDLNQLAQQLAAAIRAGAQLGVINAAASNIFGELGGILGQSVEWVILNWTTHVGPLLQAASRSALGHSPGYVAGSILRLAPSLLIGLTVAGVITQTIYRTRMAAVAAESQNQAREWQMNAADLNTWRRNNVRQYGLRVPSWSNTADIYIQGPSAHLVAEENFQNYLQAAFRARGNPNQQNITQAMAALEMVVRAANVPQRRNELEW